jgi:hypothetical protein
MSMYSNQKYNRFLGKFSDLEELLSQRPTGEDGEWAVILDVNKEYYWDISERDWIATNGSELNILEDIKTDVAFIKQIIDENINPAAQAIQNDVGNIAAIINDDFYGYVKETSVNSRQFISFGGIGEDDDYYYFGSYYAGDVIEYRIKRLSKADNSAMWSAGTTDDLEAIWADKSNLEYNLTI